MYCYVHPQICPSDYLNSSSLELTTWGGGGGLGVGASFGSMLACASAHITFAALASQLGGRGQVLIKKHVKSMRDIDRLHNKEMSR